MDKLSDKEIVHLINQDIPTDSEDGLDSDGDSLGNDVDCNDVDWDNNLLGENDSDELTKLLQQFDELDTPIDSSVIFNDPEDYNEYNEVTIDTEPSIPITYCSPNICVQSSSSSVTDDILNSNFLTRSNRNQNQPQPQQSPINSNKKLNKIL